MKTITVSDETAIFLSELANRLKNQDRRHTADPYYFTVRCVKEIAAPEDYTNEIRYFDAGCAESYTEEEMRENCKEMEVDFDAYTEENCTKYCVQDVEINNNFFFTLEGYQEHMRLNGRNYRHYKEHYDYVEHAFRNPEIAGVLKAIKEIGSAISANTEAT